MTLLRDPCACGSAYRRVADIQGRLDDVFTYPDGVVVHPHVFRSLLGRDARIPEYQVRQTPTGAEVVVCGTGAVDAAALARALEADLQRAGFRQPTVTVAVVDEIPRVGIGKLKRFVPLPAARA